jgi:hypothetical protein
MAHFQRIPIEEARKLAAAPRRLAHPEYTQYVRQLSTHTAGRIVLGEGDHPLTVRARLQAAARAEGKELSIRRRGNELVFWLREAGAPAEP